MGVVNKRWMGEVSMHDGRRADRSCVGRGWAVGTGLVWMRGCSSQLPGRRGGQGGRAKDAAALDASCWQNLEWPIELPGVDGRGAEGGRRRKKEKEKHTNCP